MSGLTVIGIEVPKDIPLQLVLNDVARSISEGYGAGTITVDGYVSYGFWTSVERNIGDKHDIVIRSKKELGDYSMAALVREYKPEKEDIL